MKRTNKTAKASKAPKAVKRTVKRETVNRPAKASLFVVNYAS